MKRKNWIQHYQRKFILDNLDRMDKILRDMYLMQTWVQRYLRRYC